MQLSRGDRPAEVRAVPAEVRADVVRADGAPADQRRWSLWIAATYLAIATALALVATLGARFPIKLLPGAEAETGVPWLDAWFRWDSGWYYSIAVDGYFFADGHQSPVAFFPTYPLAMRVVADAVGNVALAGVLITVVSGLGAVLLFWHWFPRSRGISTLSSWSVIRTMLGEMRHLRRELRALQPGSKPPS